MQYCCFLDKTNSALAMTFPTKERKPTAQHSTPKPPSGSENYLDAFFNQSLSKPKTYSRPSSTSSKKVISETFWFGCLSLFPGHKK